MSHDLDLSPEEASKARKKRIWQVMGILSLITAVEFVIAFTMHASGMRTSLFFILTFVKAFYIVADFMHLRHEVKTLMYSIVIPLVLILWLIVALLNEGAAIFTGNM